MRRETPAPTRLLSPGEVADALHVTPKTVTRWAEAGQLRCVRTVGGHRRYFADQINAILSGEEIPAVSAEI